MSRNMRTSHLELEVTVDRSSPEVMKEAMGFEKHDILISQAFLRRPFSSLNAAPCNFVVFENGYEFQVLSEGGEVLQKADYHVFNKCIAKANKT